MSLAINTNQYARTFQDRSYKFAIKKRPSTFSAPDDGTDTPTIPVIGLTERIFNVNVRGKRGNIVQTYPSVEYDFVPNTLSLFPGDLIHFQWTGSDYNPRRGWQVVLYIFIHFCPIVPPALSASPFSVFAYPFLQQRCRGWPTRPE